MTADSLVHRMELSNALESAMSFAAFAASALSST